MTGILMAHASASGRRPAVIVSLHGTGVKKEDQLALLRTLADRGGHRRRDRRAVSRRARQNRSRDRRNQRPASRREANPSSEGYLILARYRADDAPGGLPGDPAGHRSDAHRPDGDLEGGTETYLTAAVDPRIAVAVLVIGRPGILLGAHYYVWQARAATFQAALDGAARDERTHVDAALVRRFYARVAPGDSMAISTPAMLLLIAPRPLLVINGDSDARTPLPGVLECMRAAESAYAAAGAQDKLGLYLQPHSGHVFTPVAELVALDWLVRWLAP